MDDEASEKPTWSTSIDKAVFGFCELLGLVFALPFGDALYHGTPISSSQVGFLILGAAWAAAGPMWPLIRAKAARPAAESFERASRDARTWIAVLLFAFGYFFFRTPVPPPAPSPASASDIAESVVARLPRPPNADEIAQIVMRKLSAQTPQAPDAQLVNYGIDGPNQFHAIVNLRHWQDYRDFKGVLITRTVFADRDRMTDDWIAKSIAYTIDGPTLTTSVRSNNQMRFATGRLNSVEYNFVIIPSDKAPEQIHVRGDVEKLGGRILAVMGQVIPNFPSPSETPSPPSH